jgi:hypothetical protein
MTARQHITQSAVPCSALFFFCRHLTLAWTEPESGLDRTNPQSIRIFFFGQNNFVLIRQILKSFNHFFASFFTRGTLLWLFLPFPMRRFRSAVCLCCLEVSTLPLSTSWREIGKLRLMTLKPVELCKQMKNAWNRRASVREPYFPLPLCFNNVSLCTVPTWSTCRVPLATCWMKSTTCSTRKRNWQSVCQQCGTAAVPFQ